MTTHAFSALGKTPRADLHPASLVYRSRPMDGISEISFDLTTGFSVMRRKRKPLTGLALLDDVDLEDCGTEELEGVAGLFEGPGIP